MRKVMAGLVLCGAATSGLPASAQDPSTSSGHAATPKLVRIVVPFSAGASNDAIARAIAPPLSKRIGSSFIIENRPGAASVIGNDAVAKSPPDGSVLLLTSSTFLTVAATAPKPPYDPIGSFAPVATVVQNPSLLAVSAVAPFKTTAELVAAARAKPGDITYGTAGVGSITHLATELPESGGEDPHDARAVQGRGQRCDRSSGRTDCRDDLELEHALAVRQERKSARILAVTSPGPHPAFPGMPPVSGTVPGFSNQVWVGVFAPAGTPSALIERLNSGDQRDLLESRAAKSVRARRHGAGGDDAERFRRAREQELAQWKQIATSRKIVLE